MYEKKVRKTYNIEPSVYEDMGNYLKKAGVEDKASFVRKAIGFYINYLRVNESVDFIAPLINDVIKNNLNYFETNISEMLFKVAVEVSKQNITLARAAEFSCDERKEINKEACKVVSENNGILDYENAFYYYGDDD